jgi:hypothetical protein
MSIEHTKKPLIYWQVGPNGEKHEIPERASVHFWNESEREYWTITVAESGHLCWKDGNGLKKTR